MRRGLVLIMVLAIFLIFALNVFAENNYVWKCFESVNGTDYDRTIKLCTECIKHEPFQQGCYINRGNAFSDKGMYDRGIDDFNKAIELNPKYVEAYNNLAWVYATAKDKKYRNGKKAVKFALKAVSLSNTSANIDILAAAYVEDGQYNKAVETYYKAMEKSSDKVKNYQKSLKKRGYYKGEVNGKITDELKKAVKDFVLKEKDYIH